MKGIFKSKEFNIFIIIVIISILISIRNSTFLSIENLIDILKGNTVLGILAMGMLLAIITGGIDVSVGAITALVTVISGNILVKFGLNIIIVFVISGLCGSLLGLVNGWFISKYKIPPIVVTLGTLSLFSGLNLYFTNGTWITNLPQWYQDFGDIKVMGLPIQIFFLLGVALLTYFLLNHTIFGRGIYAIGGNQEAAVMIGFNFSRITVFIYSYIGFVAGIAAFVHSSIVKMVDPNAFAGYELQVVAAVVLGGANVMGGEGTVIGTLFGVLMMAVINNGLILAWVPTYWQQIIVGV